MLFINKGNGRQFKFAEALDKHLISAVNENIRDGFIREQRLDWPDAEHFVEHLRADGLFFSGRQLKAVLVADLTNELSDLFCEIIPAGRRRLHWVNLRKHLIVNRAAHAGKFRRSLCLSLRCRSSTLRHGTHAGAAHGCTPSVRGGSKRRPARHRCRRRLGAWLRSAEDSPSLPNFLGWARRRGSGRNGSTSTNEHLHYSPNGLFS